LNISVIIPVYNAAPFVAKAVLSAIEHSEVKEILLIEDGSKDNSLQICEQLSNEHKIVRLLRHHNGANEGASTSRNLGIQESAYPYVAFLDADDTFLENRFLVDKEIFKKDPSVDGVYNALGTYFYDNKLRKKYQKGGLKTLTTLSKRLNSKELFPSLLGLGNYYGYFSVVGLTLKKSSLQKMHTLFKNNMRMHEDTEFILRLAYETTLVPGNLQSPVALRGVHPFNRITQSQLVVQKAAKNKYLLWDTLYTWAIEKNIESQFKRHIRRMRQVYEITSLSGMDLVKAYLSAARKDPSLLWKNVYYSPIHYRIWGKSLGSKGVHLIKKCLDATIGKFFKE
jgi:glycosyltransferase involved in cell wall biosynthesis